MRTIASQLARDSKKDRLLVAQLIFVYLYSWIVVYYQMPLPARLVLLVLMLVIALQSYQNLTVVLLLVLFIPFYDDVFRNVDIGGITISRLLFVPFFYFSIIRPQIRKLPVNGHLLLLVLFSIFTLKISYDILYSIQDVPVKFGKEEKEGLVNFIASYLDIFIVLSFVYFVFTRLPIPDLRRVFNFLLVIVILEVISLVFMIIMNPAILILGKTGFAGYYANPFFGHKNDWGMMLTFILLFALTKVLISNKNKTFLVVVVSFCAIGVMVSLSRQALVWAIFGVLLMAFGARNFKILLGFAIVLVAILIIRPPFLIDRMESMITARTSQDFESLNRKVSDLAQKQMKKNLQLVPRMFDTNWEYNWSEGFWNGMLHQQGILGLIFHLYLYLFLFFRYYSHYIGIDDRKLKLIVGMAAIFAILMFFANFTRREAHFLHYNGIVTQINRLNFLVFMYVELAIYAFKNKLRDYQWI